MALLLGLGAVLGALVDALTGEKLTFLYKEQLGLTASGVSTLGILAGLPSYLQPLIGAGTDLYPLWGYHRRTYYVLGTLAGALGFWGLAQTHAYHYWTVIWLLILAGAGGTLAGVVTNAVLVSVGNATGTFPRLQSFLTFLPLVMGLTPWWNTNDFGGYVTEHWSYAHAFRAAALVTLLALPLVFVLDDHRVSQAAHAGETPAEHAARLEARRADRDHIRAALRAAARTPGTWAIAAFLFYLNVTPLLLNASTYYMADALHLSKQFIGSVQVWGNWGSLVALGLYAWAGKRLTGRLLVWAALLTDCGIYLVALGMHDARTAEIVTFFWALLAVALSLCVNTLAARACPPDVEAAVYGLMQSVVALSLTLCDRFGSALYDFFGPANHAHHYSTAHGWFCALWSGFAFTACAVFFLPFLPDWARSNRPLESPPEPALQP